MNDTGSNETLLFNEGLVSLELCTFQKIWHPIVLCICVSLNLFVGYVLLSDKELHNARNAIWLGVVASNLAAFFMDSLQQFVSYRRSYAACQVFSFLAGKPYVVLLVNLLLATCDRFIYTKWSLFHKIHVTVFRVVAAQLLCSVAIFLAVSYDQIEQIRCGLNVQTGKLFFRVFGSLTTLCIIAKLVVYFMVRKDNAHTERNGIVMRRIRTIDLRVQQSRSRPSGMVRELSRTSLRVYRGSRQFHRMEWNATMTLVAGLVPMFLMALLSGLFFLSHSIYRYFFDECKSFPFGLLVREICLFHFCTNLLVYVFRSKEFRSAARCVLFGTPKMKTHVPSRRSIV